MAEKVDAWMPLHIGQYMAATGHLSTDEHGMYLMLLMHAWAAGGVIPGDAERVRRICRADPKEWVRSCAAILDFLTLQPDGTYRQKRLDAEFVKAVELKENKVESGKKGAASRWRKHDGANGKPMAEPMAKQVAEPLAEAMANRCPIPPPEPPRSSTSEEPTTTVVADTTAAPLPADGGGDTKAHELASVCVVNRVTGALYNSPYVAQWMRDGVTSDILREAIAEARRTGKPNPEQIPVKYLLPIIERVRSGGGKPVDNGWRKDERRAVAKGREVGLSPRAGEEMFAFVQRIDEALQQRARSQVQ